MRWLDQSMKKSKTLKDTYSLHDIEIFIKDQLPEEIDMDFVLKYIKSRMPYHLLRGIDMIYIGKFKNLEEKEATAMYQDGAIYLTNQQDDDKDMIDDIIHEIAHSVEEMYGHGIYDDGTLEREFLAKRKRLFLDLEAHNYTPPAEMQYKTEYVQKIDDYLYLDVTYDAMWHFVGGLFPSPYAATSIREYFARGFEEYCMDNKKELKQTCPVLYRKIKSLYKMEE
jgi:Mlc titration factor MtfA (ptsG expression regulator)